MPLFQQRLQFVANLKQIDHFSYRYKISSVLNMEHVFKLRLVYSLLIAYTLFTCVRTAPTDEIEVDDDYFYDTKLSDAEIDQIQAEKQREQELAEREKAKATVTAPAFFAKLEEKPDQDIDLQRLYMEQMMKIYMKKYQEEQLEKRRAKFKSDLNHPMLSIITLTCFFGINSIIGLIIVYIRGKQFRKNDSNNGEKKAYTSVEQNETPVVWIVVFWPFFLACILINPKNRMTEI